RGAAPPARGARGAPRRERAPPARARVRQLSARRAALLLVLVAAAAGGAWLVGRERPHHLPARILVQDTVTDAVTLFATGGAVAEPADGAKLGALQPSVLFKE